MIKQSDLALAAWKATERTLDAVVTINKIDYKTTDIASISYDAGGYTGDTFGIGSNYENSVTIKFSHLIEGLKPGMTVWPKIGIKTSNGYEYSSLGLFIVSDDIQMDRNNDETTIKAYDQMCLLEGTYTSKLTYPAKMTSVIAEIANLAGVLLNTTDISRLPVQVNLPSAITGQTYRNAIGMIAQFYAGFATFDRDGKLTIRTITEPDYTLDPSQYEQGGLTKNEAPYKIGGIQCEVTTTTTDSTGQSTETTNTLQVGAASGSQIKLTNNLMTMDRLASIWQQLQSLTFYPFSLNWFGNPAIEAGDWLTLQDTKGNKFNVPNNGYTMTFDGSLSTVSKADQTSTSSSSYAWRGELSQYVADLGGRQGASGNYIYGTDTTEPPYGAKFNDIWYKQNGNKVELWTYERQADGTGKWVLTVSDATGEEVKAKVDQVELEAKASTDAAKAASDKADQLAAKYDDTNALANQAMDKAVGAQSEAGSAIAKAESTASEFGKVSQKADSVFDNAMSAQNAASSAVATANSTASEFGNVSHKADSAVASALNAQSAASDAVKQASSAAADSKDAKQIAGAVSQSYQTLTDGSTMTIAELESGLAVKLTKSDLDGYATETWAQNQIKVSADGINGTISSIKSTVDGQTTSINDLKADSSSFKSQFTTVNDTLGKQTTDIGTLQATSKELTSGFNTLTTDNTTNKNDISQLKQTATEVSSTLETVQTQVQNSAVGTNLLINSNFSSGLDYWVLNRGTNSDCKAVVTTDSDGDTCVHIAGTGNYCGLWCRTVSFDQNQVTTGSVLAKGTGTLNWVGLSSRPASNFGTISTESYSKVGSTMQAASGTNSFCVYFNPVNGVVDLYIKFVKLELGSHATDYSTNPLDTATVTAVSKLSQTVDGMKLDISKKIEQSDLNGYATEIWAQNQIKVSADGINGTISSIKSTVDGQTTDINDLKADSSSFKSQFTTVNNTLGKQTTDISTLQATSKELTSGFNTLTTDNTTNKNDISQLKQTATELNSTMTTVQTQVQNSAVGTNLLVGTSSSEQSHTGDFSTIPGWGWGNFPPGSQPAVNVGSTYTYSIYFTKLTGSFVLGYWGYDSDKNYIGWFPSGAYSSSGKVSYTFTIPSGISYIAPHVVHFSDDFACTVKEEKLELGSHATDWCLNPTETATVTAFSKLSQTVDGIKTDVSKKIEQKDLNGYATETWTQNQIKMTADGLSGTLSSVKNTVDGHTTSINDLKADSSGFKTQFATVNDTLGKHSTDIGTLQATSKSLGASFDSLSSDNQTNQHNISQLQASATAFNSTLMTVQQQVTDSSVGINLLRNTRTLDGWAVWGGSGGGKGFNIEDISIDSGLYRMAHIFNNVDGQNSDAPYWPGENLVLTAGQVYTISIWAHNLGPSEQPVTWTLWLNWAENNTYQAVRITNTTAHDWARYSASFTADRSGEVRNVRIVPNFEPGAAANVGGSVYLLKPKLERGSRATDFSVNPADNATVTAVSSISQTINSIQTTVRGKVDNDTYQSKVTQLSGQITSVVGQVNTFGKRNIVTNSQFQYDYMDGTSWTVTGSTTDMWYKSDYAWSWVNGYQGICFNKPTTTADNVWYALHSRRIVIGQDISTPWSASAYVNVNTVGINAVLTIEFYDTKGNRIGLKETYKNSHGLELIKVENAVPPAGTETVGIAFQVHGGGYVAMICPMLNQGTTAAAFVPDNVSNAELEHAYSAILQTNDRIELRVEKNGVINAINVTPERIKISGNKLHITADTYIDNAIIKDAMIESLNADKITAGTINAANINVINLNANNITTGTINGSNLSINLNTGNVEFQAGRIHSADNSIDINVNNKYISVADKDNRVFISGGQIQMIQPTLFSSQSTPYVRISNAQAGASWGGATFWGRDYFVVTNGANDGNIFTSPMGEEKFAGISGGHSTSGWQVTKIGGAERGVLISGGREFTDGIGLSPYIRVGDPGHAGTGLHGSNISMQASYIYLKSTHSTSHGANAYLAPDGALVPSNSAAKYKTDIVRSFETGMGDKLLEVPVAHWKDKEEVLSKTLNPSAKNPETYFGMIADDLDDAGLNELVEYDDKGAVRGIQYDRVALALIPLIRNYRDRITELETKVK
ncbi:prophage protein [Lactiplantibacillus plantarum]|uniref:gp58-like family protein n=1 Tax=Lactiplantibacillus plantarum TaxID=1590 RepID=UPI0036D352AE|nr:prophage protein [Lactiplantibacillus plantarum]